MLEGINFKKFNDTVKKFNDIVSLFFFFLVVWHLFIPALVAIWGVRGVQATRAHRDRGLVPSVAAA